MTKWTAIWVKGTLKLDTRIWKEWRDSIIKYTETESFQFTHFGASSPTFRSGKYLSFSHSQKRLANALSRDEDFQSLSFIAVDQPFITMAQDQWFGASLSITREHSLLANFDTSRFNKDQFQHFEELAIPFFSSGRLERFQIGPGDLPINYVINFERNGSDGRTGFISSKIENF